MGVLLLRGLVALVIALILKPFLNSPLTLAKGTTILAPLLSKFSLSIFTSLFLCVFLIPNEQMFGLSVCLF